MHDSYPNEAPFHASVRDCGDGAFEEIVIVAATSRLVPTWLPIRAGMRSRSSAG